MSRFACANCRSALTAIQALTNGKLCEKCKWAASCADFCDDNAKTQPRTVVAEVDPFDSLEERAELERRF